MNQFPSACRLNRPVLFRKGEDGFSFYDIRNGVVLVIGLLMAAAGVRYGLLSHAVDGGWALYQWPFLFVIIVGVAIMVRARSSHSHRIPGFFVTDQLEQELMSETDVKESALISFRPPVEFLSKATRSFYAPVAQRLSVFRHIDDDVVEKTNQLIIMNEGMVTNLFASAVDPKKSFKQARTKTRMILAHLELLQKKIAAKSGRSGLLEFERQCRLISLRETVLPPDFNSILSNAKAMLLSTAETEAESKKLAEEICLKFRALYLACLITLTYFPGAWNSELEEEVFDLFGRATDQMHSLDNKSKFTFNVERRRLLLEDAVTDAKAWVQRNQPVALPDLGNSRITTLD